MTRFPAQVDRSVVVYALTGQWCRIKAEEVRASLVFKDETEFQDELEVLIESMRLVLWGIQGPAAATWDVALAVLDSAWKQIEKGVRAALLAEHQATRHYDVWNMPEGSEWWV